MENVSVSIVIPCYNNMETIREAVRSCTNQSYKDFEVVVVNDGSTDGSWSVIQELSAQFPQVKAFSQDNQGPAKARNYGASLATGDYIVFLDADDRFAPVFLAECMAVFKKNPNIDIVYALTEKFEGEEGIWKLPDYSPEKILFENCFPISSMVALKKFVEIGMFDEDLQHAEDWEMWIRMTALYPKVYQIKKPLMYYRKRIGKDSITDMNQIHNYEDYTHLYIYNKHYELYRSRQMSINDLLYAKREGLKYKHKYYNEWYRKWVYKWFLKGKIPSDTRK